MSDTMGSDRGLVVDLTTELLRQIRDGVHRNGEHLSQLAGRVDALGREQQGTRELLARAERRLTARFDVVEESLAHQSERIDQLEHASRRLTDAMGTVTSAVNRALDRQVELDARVTRLESDPAGTPEPR